MNSSWALSPHPGLLVSTASAASCAPIPFATIMYAAHANAAPGSPSPPLDDGDDDDASR